MRVAGRHFHLQHQPQRADHEAVIGVTGAAGLGGIVAENGLDRLRRSSLLPIQRLHRGVGIQDPGFAQQRAGGAIQLRLQSRNASVGFDPLKGTADRVLAQHPVHAQQRRIDRVGTQRGDVSIPAMAGQHRE